MPGGDGTGPGGMGPMTGRGAGYCAGYPVPGFMNPTPGMGFGGGGFGRGFGRGFGGGGRGRRNWFYATGMPGYARAAAGMPAWGGVGGGVPQGAYGVAPAAYGVPGTAYGVPPQMGYVGPQVTKEQELDALKGQTEYLEDALAGIRKRMDELEKPAQE